MSWITWRQHRMEFLLIISVLMVCIAFLLITGLNMAQTFHSLGLSACLAHPNTNICGNAESAFTNQYSVLLYTPLVPVVLVVIFGVFVGAPLVARELEQGTHRLVWTQGVSRLRWLSVKLGVILGVGIPSFSLLCALLLWMYAPLFAFVSPLSPANFDATGPVLPASAVLALALGVFAGALTRRTVPAMLLALVLFLFIKFPVALGLRPNYLPAITVVEPLNGDGSISMDGSMWLTSFGMLDPQGNKTSQTACANGQVQPCGYRSYYTYQPGDRYWLFQWIETGIDLACAVLAFGAAGWLVMRRLT